MRKAVVTYVLVCDGCLAKDGSETEATETLRCGAREWHLCAEHVARFSRYLVDTLGTGLPDEENGSEPVIPLPEPVAEEPETEAHDAAPAPVKAEEPTPEADLADYVSRITDSRKAFKGRRLDATSQAAQAQWARHRERLAALPDKERADYLKWCAAEGMDARLTASHVEFRAFMWSTFPHMARAYADTLRNQSPQEQSTPDAPALSDRERNRAVRQWARANGHSVPERGRIPLHIRHAYQAAHQDTQDTAERTAAAA